MENVEKIEIDAPDVAEVHPIETLIADRDIKQGHAILVNMKTGELRDITVKGSTEKTTKVKLALAVEAYGSDWQHYKTFYGIEWVIEKKTKLSY